MMSYYQSKLPFKIIPLHPKFGIRVVDMDLRNQLDLKTCELIKELFLSYKVLLFDDQKLNDEQLINFARIFGELEKRWFSHPDANFSGVYNMRSGPNSPPKDTNCWHSDWSGSENPSLGILLSAVEVPTVGGDTIISNMILAYQALPNTIKERIKTLYATHSTSEYIMKYSPSSGSLFETSSIDHPIVRTHPETGEKILYVNEKFTKEIKNMPRRKGGNLLRILCKQAAIPEHQIRIKWEKNSLLIFDNRCTQHYAIADYGDSYRHLKRIVIAGDKPF